MNKGFYPGPNGLLLPKYRRRVQTGDSIQINDRCVLASDCTAAYVPNGNAPGDFIDIIRESTTATTLTFQSTFGSDYGSDTTLVVDTSTQIKATWTGSQWWLDLPIALTAYASGEMHVYHNTTQTTSVSGLVYPSFNTVARDALGIWDATNTRAVIKVAGVYSIFFRCTPNNNTGAVTTPFIDLNGNLTWGQDSSSAVHSGMSMSRYLAVGDVVKAGFYKGAAGTYTIMGSGADQCEFYICGPS